jgi:hypothetical protein
LPQRSKAASVGMQSPNVPFERLDESRNAWPTKNRRFAGASRTRTGDLLGAMLALELRRIRIVKRFRPTGIVSPNSFPNISPAVLQ